MTEPSGPTDRAGRPATKTRKSTVAPASRVLAAGLSIGAACAIVTALAMSQPPETSAPVDLDVATAGVEALPTTTTAAAPPPTTIVINKIYVPVPAGGGDPGGTSSGTSGTTRRTSGGTSGGSGGATASSGSTSQAPAVSSAPAPAAAPAPAPAPVAKSKAS